MAFRFPKLFNCHVASEMTSRRLSGGKLGLYDRFALGFHLLICAGCRFVDQQLALIDAVARRAGAVPPTDHPTERDADGLPEDAKERIRKVIR